MNTKATKTLLLYCLFLIITFALLTPLQAQRKSKRVSRKPPEKPQSSRVESTKTNNANETEKQNKDESQPQKRNLRDSITEEQPENLSRPKTSKVESVKEHYFYQFDSPQFNTKRVRIEHDENGRGKITVWKNDLDEEISEPIQLSPKTIEKLKSLFRILSFLDSSEDYQSKVHDYKHLGTATIGLKTSDKERTVSFNWTENKNAKLLADEYRKIYNQQLWMFEMRLARENQPLEAPDLMRKLDSYLRRNEISDPEQMLEFLEDLSNDERIPLIARNHSRELIEKIKKSAKK
ncbi:MAG: hypothetical protein D6735_00745 [Acidobacteria bacterium]|nr:MAG: hypothetical protein D6735_00745 [Acidobacteriota bacterium]